jgi:predicted ester cyclase
VAAYRAAIPDLRVAHDEVVVAGDHVVVHWTLTGTHLRPFRDGAPSGQPVELSGLTTFRVPGGQVTETWFQAEALD